MSVSLSVDVLRKIVKEEIKRLNEATVDHASMAEIVSAASKLLAAIDAFKEKAGDVAISAVAPHIEKIERSLEDMVNTPGSYVVKPSNVKKVTLKPVKDDEV